MDLKKEVKEIIKWAGESDENKKNVMNFATSIIYILNSSSKNISDKDLDDLFAGENKSSNHGCINVK